MKYLIVLFLVLSACGKKSDTHVDESVSCVHDVSAEMVLYGDGATRKSEVVNCTYSSGKTCMYATFVSDPTITYSNCH